jgi:hypothetical protein
MARFRDHGLVDPQAAIIPSRYVNILLHRLPDLQPKNEKTLTQRSMRQSKSVESKLVETLTSMSGVLFNDSVISVTLDGAQGLGYILFIWTSHSTYFLTIYSYAF